MKKFYITTAIDYVNANPHLGHAYEKICADVIARWHRLKGEDVFFLTGTDENAQKNEQAAKQAGIETKKFVDTNTKKFVELCEKLNLTNDEFIRTTEDRHKKIAQLIFKKLHDKGDIYKSAYEGLYCTGCESFLTEKDLVDGKCPEHDKKPDWIKEESYFFKMSKYQDKILDLLKTDFILPESKRKEMLSRVESEGLKDLCVSRKNLSWGIETPIDKDHKIYVWIDALSNYVSALDYPTGKRFKKYWPADIHLIGKGINWFHSVIWPSLLLAADIPIPKLIFVHGYVNLSGKKMSKSKGIVVDPLKLIDKYSTDALRYFLIREIRFGEDGDFSEAALKDRLNNELANDLGNLLTRTLSMVEKYFKGKIPEGKNELKFNISNIKEKMEDLNLTEALADIWKIVNETNRYINEKKPWESDKKEKILYTVLDNLRILSILLYPFVPETAEKITKQLGLKKIGSLKDCKPNLLGKGKINKGEMLFKKAQ